MKLKIGDKVNVISHNYNIILEIERVTKTKAVTKPYSIDVRWEFKIDTVDGIVFVKTSRPNKNIICKLIS